MPLLILLQASVFLFLSGFMNECRNAFNSDEFLPVLPVGAFPRMVLLTGANAAASERIILYDSSDLQQQEMETSEQSPPEGKECTPQPWQTASHSNCNDMHSLNMGDLLIQGSSQKQDGLFHIFKEGGSRITGKLGMSEQVYIFKTSRFHKSFDEQRYERGRREAVAMEMLRGFSPDVYGVCGMSSLTEYGDGGNLHHVLVHRNAVAPLTKLEYAVNISRAVAAVHSIDEDYASLIHKDMDASNVVMFDGKWKLIDFNAAVFVEWNTTSKQPCWPSQQRPHHSIDTSPLEEIQMGVLDDKMDVYFLGGLLFSILTDGTRLYHCERPEGICNDGNANNSLSHDEIRVLKANGTPPHFPKDLVKSMDPAVVAIRTTVLQAVQMDPKQRPSAKGIADKLERVQRSLLKNKS